MSWRTTSAAATTPSRALRCVFQCVHLGPGLIDIWRDQTPSALGRRQRQKKTFISEWEWSEMEEGGLTDATRPLIRVQGKTSKTTGNAGGRIACGVVGLAAA